MFASLARAARLIFDPAFAGIVLKSLLLTIFLFAAGLALTEYGLAHLPVLGKSAGEPGAGIAGAAAVHFWRRPSGPAGGGLVRLAVSGSGRRPHRGAGLSRLGWRGARPSRPICAPA